MNQAINTYTHTHTPNFVGHFHFSNKISADKHTLMYTHCSEDLLQGACLLKMEADQPKK